MPSAAERRPSCACPFMLDSMNALNPAPIPNAASAPRISILSAENAPAAFLPCSAISLVCLSEVSPSFLSDVPTSFWLFWYSRVSSPSVMNSASMTLAMVAARSGFVVSVHGVDFQNVPEVLQGQHGREFGKGHEFGRDGAGDG